VDDISRTRWAERITISCMSFQTIFALLVVKVRKERVAFYVTTSRITKVIHKREAFV